MSEPIQTIINIKKIIVATDGSDTSRRAVDYAIDLLKSRIEIPLDNVAKVSTEQVKPVWLPRRRIGTHVQGGFMAGTFWLKREKISYFVKDFSKCITLHLKNHEYSKVIVQVDDKASMADRIRISMA